MSDVLFYDVAGSSELLGPGFASTAIKRAMREGRLPYQKVGKRVSISRSDLLVLAEATRSAPTPDGRARGVDGMFTKAPKTRKPAKRRAA
jgi:hypothetical protein